MRSRPIAILVLLLLSLCGGLASSDVDARSRAQAAEMAAFFHDDLAPYGHWVEHQIYGTVWVPDSGRPDWHPYWDGRWVWTSDYGWYWHSYEPYGWATYHYGRWVLTADYGWVWVPDAVWGPAWVEWRYGGGYAGWAPMPPEQQRKGGSVEARAWIFVPEGDIAKTDMQRAGGAQVVDLLAASSAAAGAGLAARFKVQPEVVVTTSSSAEQAAAQAKGRVAIYRPAFLLGLNLAAPAGLNLDVPVDTATEIDPDAAKAKAKLDDVVLPEKPVSGSVDSAIGGTFGGEGTVRAPSSSGSGGIGIGIPAAGGVRLGR